LMADLRVAEQFVEAVGAARVAGIGFDGAAFQERLLVAGEGGPKGSGISLFALTRRPARPCSPRTRRCQTPIVSEIGVWHRLESRSAVRPSSAAWRDPRRCQTPSAAARLTGRKHEALNSSPRRH